MKHVLRALSLVLLLALLLPAASPAQAEDFSEAASLACASVVQVIPMKETWSREAGAGIAPLGYGSGVYLADSGCVVTLAHVVKGAEWVDVVTDGGVTVRSASLAVDEDTDLAVILLEEPLDLPGVALGDSAALVPGEPVLSAEVPMIGEFPLFDTVYAGIVSGVGRTQLSASFFGSRLNVIQADVRMLDGQSGGALLNASGELVGIPTFKLVGGDWGPVFCVPSETVRQVVDSVLSTGKVMRPRMGLLLVEYEGPEEAIVGYYPPARLVVQEVDPDSPAQKAGLKPYDIITYVQGKRVYTHADLSAQMEGLGEGDVVRLIVCRCFDEEGNWLEAPIKIKINVVLQLME